MTGARACRGRRTAHKPTLGCTLPPLPGLICCPLRLSIAMIGIRFCPRIRNLHHQRISCADPQRDHGPLETVLQRVRRTVNFRLIADSGNVSASYTPPIVNSAGFSRPRMCCST